MYFELKLAVKLELCKRNKCRTPTPEIPFTLVLESGEQNLVTSLAAAGY